MQACEGPEKLLQCFLCCVPYAPTVSASPPECRLHVGDTIHTSLWVNLRGGGRPGREPDGSAFCMGVRTNHILSENHGSENLLAAEAG